MRDTSIEVFKRIQENGLLTHRRFQVYEYLYNNGPCTARQIELALRQEAEMKGLTVTSGWHERLHELRDQGVIRELGKTDSENGPVILWDVTSSLPMEIPKKVSERQRLEAEVDKLTVENKRLKLFMGKARALVRSAAHISSVATFLKESEGL